MQVTTIARTREILGMSAWWSPLMTCITRLFTCCVKNKQYLFIRSFWYQMPEKSNHASVTFQRAYWRTIENWNKKKQRLAFDVGTILWIILYVIFRCSESRAVAPLSLASMYSALIYWLRCMWWRRQRRRLKHKLEKFNFTFYLLLCTTNLKFLIRQPLPAISAQRH